MRIAAVAFRDFPPFADAIMEFPRCGSNGAGGEVHLLTGANGTGKTRLLCLLAAACGNSASLDQRVPPERAKRVAVVGEGERGVPRGGWVREQGRAFWTEARDAATLIRSDKPFPVHEQSPNIATCGRAAAAALAFRGMARVSDAKISALAPVKLGPPAEHLTFEPAKEEDKILCQSMANLKMAAAMDFLRKSPRTESRAIRLVERLESALTRITGRSFAFDVTPHPDVSLRVFWGGVTMSLMQTPDGLRSIIGWLVSCVSKLAAMFPEDGEPLSRPLILLLDEPEGHLHPAWQRKVLPAAQALFPHAQVFAATHSPFVISSVNEGWIHIFRADDAGTVTVDAPRECSKGDTYLDVVEEVLGVKEWYDPETEELLAKFRQTRDAILAGKGDRTDLESQAKVIAERSESLRDLMAREMRQLDRVVAQASARP